MDSVTSFELFEAMYNDIKGGASERDILKEYGGGYLYIPTYRSTFLHEDINRDCRDGASIIELCRKYGLSKNRVWELTREVRHADVKKT
jgi:Mor family transcriptional regulator